MLSQLGPRAWQNPLVSEKDEVSLNMLSPEQGQIGVSCGIGRHCQTASSATNNVFLHYELFRAYALGCVNLSRIVLAKL